MIRLLMALKNALPPQWWPYVRHCFWAVFWTVERLKQRSVFKIIPPSIIGSERATLIEAIAEHAPFNNILEVGCAYGQNFRILSQMYPNVKITGIDSSQECVEYGAKLIEDEKIGNIEFICADSVNLSQFPDRSFDLVFTCASLLYVNRAKIGQVIKEMLRVSRGTLVFLELHHENPYHDYQAAGVYILREVGLSSFWVRDYVKLLSLFVPESSIKLKKIQSPIWIGEPWGLCGYCIIVNTYHD